MNLCILGAGAIALSAGDFTLSWTHSVERTEWVEFWNVRPGGLELMEARVRGSGAGMEPPPGARLANGWWVYVPTLPPQPQLSLAASGTTGGGWTLCADGTCRTLGAAAGPAIVLCPCGLAGCDAAD